MRQKLALIGIGLAMIAALLLWESFYDGGFTNSEEDYVSDIDGKITRAEMAKMLSLLVYTREEANSLERVIIYEDSTSDKWYDKYINSAYQMGLFNADESQVKAFQPMGYVTFSQLEGLVNRIIIQKGMDGEDMTAAAKELLSKVQELQADKNEEDYVTRLKWMELYEILYTKVYSCDLTEEVVYVLGCWENNQTIDKWKVATNKGYLVGDGLNFMPYDGQSVKVLLRGNEVVSIMEVVEETEVLLPNVWIAGEEEGQLRLYINSCERTYALAETSDTRYKGKVADVTLKEGKIAGVNVKKNVITERVLLTGEDYIELERYGKLTLAEDFCIYKTYDGLEMEEAKAILVGYSNTEFILEDGELCAAVIKEPIQVDKIRVLIKTDNFSDIIHNEIRLTADCDFIVSYGLKEESYTKGQKITLKPTSSMLEKGRVFIKPKDTNGKITLLSIQRNQMNPSYRGTMEITSKGEGMILVNELSIEEYLYAVIPSEMPTSYGTEALKVQAICARSYAYKQLIANSCSEYGAHVDDSVSYQVYNNIPENEVSVRAVKETHGKVLRYDGEIITAYYFSTSCGHTTNAQEVWNSAEPVPYLVGRLQAVDEISEDGTGKGTSKEKVDLSKEETFKAFLTQNAYDIYEEEMAWYRWNVTLSKEELKNSIDQNLRVRYEANPKLIQTLQEDGSFLSVPVDTVGKVKEIQVTRRQTGGIITEIVIVGSKNTVKVMTEYNIRTVLAPLESAIIRQDKSKVESLTMLPSAFFVLEPMEKEGKFAGYKVIGGGYGHGVGMSQNGAKAMVDAGMKHEEVLKHFYEGVEIGVIYNDWNCDH